MRRVIVVAVAMLAGSWLASAASDVVTVDGGQLRGTSAGGVRVFKGIPFAAPPVGALRWKPPQPVFDRIDGLRSPGRDGANDSGERPKRDVSGRSVAESRSAEAGFVRWHSHRQDE